MTRMFEQTEIVPGRAQEHGHLVETDAALGLVEHAADDFNRLAALARRRKQHDVAGALALRRTFDREHVPPQVREIGRRGGSVIDALDARTALAESASR